MEKLFESGGKRDPNWILFMCCQQVIAIPDDDEKGPTEGQEKKNGEEPMETEKTSNGEAEGAKEKEGEEGEGDKKSSDGGEESKPSEDAKTETSEEKPEEPEAKGKIFNS